MFRVLHTKKGIPRGSVGALPVFVLVMLETGSFLKHSAICI